MNKLWSLRALKAHFLCSLHINLDNHNIECTYPSAAAVSNGTEHVWWLIMWKIKTADAYADIKGQENAQIQSFAYFWRCLLNRRYRKLYMQFLTAFGCDFYNNVCRVRGKSSPINVHFTCNITTAPPSGLECSPLRFTLAELGEILEISAWKRPLDVWSH